MAWVAADAVEVSACSGAPANARNDTTLHSESALASGEWTRSAGLRVATDAIPDWVRRMTGSLIYLPPYCYRRYCLLAGPHPSELSKALTISATLCFVKPNPRD